MKKLSVIISCTVLLIGFLNLSSSDAQTVRRKTSSLKHQKPNISNSLALILKYEKFIINNEQPNEPGVQTKYDDQDFRVIVWNDVLNNSPYYDNKTLKDMGYDYEGVTEDDNDHRTYTYRNCDKNLILEIAEWYNTKLSIYMSWFSNRVKMASGRFIGCKN